MQHRADVNVYKQKLIKAIESKRIINKISFVLFLVTDSAIFRQNLTLNLNEPRQSNNKFGSLDLRGLSNNKELNLNLNATAFANAVDLIDVSIPLERQG